MGPQIFQKSRLQLKILHAKRPSSILTTHRCVHKRCHHTVTWANWHKGFVHHFTVYYSKIMFCISESSHATCISGFKV